MAAETAGHLGQIAVEADGGRATVALRGRAVIGTIEHMRRDSAAAADARHVTIDLSGVEAMDTAGAWLVVDMARALRERGAEVEVSGASAAQSELLSAVEESLSRIEEAPAEPRHPLAWLEALGRHTVSGLRGAAEIVAFLGAVVARLFGLIRHPSRLRLTSLVHQMELAGWQAIPIVTLMAFLIGVVLAFQGATQLRQFGAEVFVVELIAISVLRELGILLTAIIVAGRTGAAFTAAIGSMKMREEIDAMRTLGLDPIEVLVVPRVLALMLVLPVLGFIANVAGLVGGALMSWIELGVSPGMFQTRLANEVGVWNYGVGMIKAPFFALIIAVVGCYEGMKVEGNAESLGRLTSASVVLAIFLVILADALFSIFFSVLGV